MVKFGEIIRNYRQEHQMSLREFAEKCNVSHSYISKLEAGVDPRSGKEVIPTILSLDNIAKGMGITLETLLNDIGYTKNREEPEIHIPQEYKHKVTKRDVDQYKKQVLEKVDAFFMDDECPEEAKEEMFQSLSNLFWKAKEMNKRKKKT